jgi:hypothetical protein
MTPEQLGAEIGKALVYGVAAGICHRLLLLIAGKGRG